MLYIVHGRTGPGKSSLINMMNDGKSVAKEGSDWDAETFSATIYNTSFPDITLMDTPGLDDIGNGLSNEDIQTLIRATLISTSNKEINGIILVFDPTQTKIYIEKLIESILSMFNPNILKQTLYVFNKINKLNPNKVNNLIEYTINKLSPIYQNYNIKYDKETIKQNIILLDTKNDIKKYSIILKNSIINSNNNKISILTDNEINTLINSYYKNELNKNENYKIIIDKISHSEIRTKTVKKPKDEIYYIECNCVTKKKKFAGITYKKKRKCGQCARTRTIQIDTIEEYPYIWYENKERKVLAFSEEYLKEKAKKAMIDDMKKKVYQTLKDKTHKFKDEI